MSRHGKDDTVEVEVEVIFIAETDRAYGVNRDEDDDEMLWLPKSQIHNNVKAGLIKGATIKVELPEWLATERGLV